MNKAIATLLVVERKLSRDLELARVRLAVAQREAAARERDVQRLEQEAGQHAAMPDLRFGWAAQASGLQFLAAHQSTLADKRRAAALQASEVEAARGACVQADRVLATTGKLRSGVQARAALEVDRRQARAADAEWLARSAHAASAKQERRR